jgi:dTDP-4-amino-4,6-dideoxygalactose transaminase
MIPFNKPYFSGKELEYIKQSLESGKISGDGIFTKKVHNYFQEKYNFKKCLLTTSCTDALEMCAILLEIKDGDEVIMPAYTFVSTANAFVLRGAKIIFVDSKTDHPGIDENKIEKLITNKTKAIVVVHYAGVSCDMNKILTISEKYNLFIIEDAAQAIDSYYIDNSGRHKPLGSIGHLAAFSFHETKNIISGEGGMLVINDDRFSKRAEIIREKGTNRSAFFRGEIDKYGWVDVGSSFLPSDIIAAFLYAQLENLDKIQLKRKLIWERYFSNLSKFESLLPFKLPLLPKYATNNSHMFYLVFEKEEYRRKVIDELNENKIKAVFHYLSLNKSTFFNQSDLSLINSDNYTDCLLRLPFYYDLTEDSIDKICNIIVNCFPYSLK